MDNTVNIPTWDQYLQRNKISDLTINAPYSTSFGTDSLYEAGEISASKITSGNFTAIQTIGGGSGNGKIDIDGQLLRILFTDSNGIPAIVLQV